MKPNLFQPLAIARASGAGSEAGGGSPLTRAVKRWGRGGFTLIELLVVVLVIMVLAGLVLYAMHAFNDRLKTSQTKAEIRALELAVENYRKDVGQYPSSLSALVSGNKKYIDWPVERMVGTQLMDPWGGAYFMEISDDQFIAKRPRNSVWGEMFLPFRIASSTRSVDLASERIQEN